MLCVAWFSTTLPSALCFPSSLSSSFSFSCSSPSSSMWGTRTLRTLANEDLGTLAENDPLTIIPVPGHKVLTFGCCFEYDSGRKETRFAMYSDRLVGIWCVGRCPEHVEPTGHSSVILLTWKSKQNGTSCLFIIWAGKGIKSTSCVPVVIRWPRAMGP